MRRRDLPGCSSPSGSAEAAADPWSRRRAQCQARSRLAGSSGAGQPGRYAFDPQLRRCSEFAFWFWVTLSCVPGGMQLNETVALPPLDEMLTVAAVLVGPAWVTWSCCEAPGATDPLAGLRLAAPLDEVADQRSVGPPLFPTMIGG